MASQKEDGDGSLSCNSLQELRDKATVKLTTSQLNHPSICNLILKLYDEGKHSMDLAHNEKAYIYLYRFVESYLKLKSSKLFKDDRNYVDLMITSKRVNEVLGLLEQLGTTLNTLYAEKKSAQEQREKQEADEAAKVAAEANEAANEKAKQSQFASGRITPQELADLLDKHVDKRVLVVDLRPRAEFEHARMNLNWLLLKNRQQQQHSVAYISVPGDLIDVGTVTWKVRDMLAKLDGKELVSQQRSVVEVFDERDKFDLVVLFDDAGGAEPGEKLVAFKRALFHYDEEHARLKREPLVLDGGWSQWRSYYPVYCTTTTTTTATPFKELTSTLNRIDTQTTIEYPSLDDLDKKKAPAQAPTPVNDSPTVVVAQQPSVDRSKKPSKPSIVTTTSENIAVISDKASQLDMVVDSKSEEKTVVVQVEEPHQPTTNEQNENKPPPPPPPPKVPVFRPPTLNNVNVVDKGSEFLMSQVYRPLASAQFGRPIQTPLMRDHAAGQAKVLNMTTGMYVPATWHVSPPALPLRVPQPPAPEPSVAKFVPPRPSPSTKPTSTLKRTQSIPNIAEAAALDDVSEQVAKMSKVSIRPESAVVAAAPTVNRLVKPMEPQEYLSRVRDMQPVYASVPPGLTGIRNLGNTCFMNSVMQCLSHTRALREYFLSSGGSLYRRDLNRENELGFNGEIADWFAVIVRAMWEGMYKILAPRRFKMLIGDLNEQFYGDEQHDSQEFLLFLLDGLHEDLNKVRKRPQPRNDDEYESQLEKLPDARAAEFAWQVHLSVNNSVIVDLFQGQFRSTVECLTCHKRSLKFEPFMYLTLPLPSSGASRCSLYECLETFLQPETMSGESQWNCPKCKQKRNAVKKIDIWKLPRVLIVHLKRFKYQGVFRDKINTMVDFPVDTLELGDYMLYKNGNNNNNSSSSTYRLFAVSNHSGTMDGGHYTSMCYHSELRRWFKFDDSEISELAGSKLAGSLKTPFAYILFYALV